MDRTSIDKKIREAKYFLLQMREFEQLAHHNEPEEFDYLLSAFLSAARTVDYRSRYVYKQAYSDFFNKWNQQYPTEDKISIFMAEDRRVEVHDNGSEREQGEERMPIYGHYRDKSCTIIVTSPPLGWTEQPAAIIKPAYFYRVPGEPQERRVTEVCAEWLQIIEQRFEAFIASTGT